MKRLTRQMLGFQRFHTTMMLAFLIDQVQQLGCRLFQAASARFHARTVMWERLRGRLTEFTIPDWPTLWRSFSEHSTTGWSSAQ